MTLYPLLAPLLTRHPVQQRAEVIRYVGFHQTRKGRTGSLERGTSYTAKGVISAFWCSSESLAPGSLYGFKDLSRCYCGSSTVIVLCHLRGLVALAPVCNLPVWWHWADPHSDPRTGTPYGNPSLCLDSKKYQKRDSGPIKLTSSTAEESKLEGDSLVSC